MTALRGLAVVVPAHDEQDLVLLCLDALAAARHRLADLRPDITTSVTVVLDACRDDTAARARTHADVDVVEVDVRCVGAARGAGTAHALAGLGLPSGSVWTAHTDADSQVPPGWLVAMTVVAEAGADALLGSVVPDAAADPPVRAAWSALNPPLADHPYVHGANFGVRASVLAEVGGWNPLTTGEDVDLAERLRSRPGVDVRTVADGPVVTSSRAVARAPLGFSSYLRDLIVA